MIATVGRLLWVCTAFIMSAAATVFFLFYIAQERFFQAMAGRGPESITATGLFELARQGQLLLSGMTIVPALLVVIVGEIARIRSSLYYIVGLGLALAAVPLLGRYGTMAPGAPMSSIVPQTLVWQVFATAGFLGGWVYWFLAGRRA